MEKKGKFITIIADNLTNALNKASNHLKIPVNEIRYEIIEQKANIKLKIYLRESNPTTMTRSSEGIDGYFKIKYKDGYATLTVMPPLTGGKDVYIEDVIKRIKLLNIPKVDYDLIKNIISEKSGKPVNIALWEQGREFRPNLELRISEDKIRAFIKIIEPKTSITEITKDDILFEFESKDINYGINEDKIDEIISKKIFNCEVEIASGILPIDGEDEYIEPLFDVNPGKPFLVDEYDRVNLKELNFIQNKFKGDVVANYFPRREGRNGIDVFGEIIPFKIYERPKISWDQNIVKSEDGLKLITTVDGNCFIRNNRLQIEPVVTYQNVDYKTGNVEFVGSVLINQSVLDGFYIKSEGTIQIGQSVSKVRLESKGDVILKAGITGNGEGIIICEGDLYAKFIEGAKIVCHGNLFVEEAIMNSSIKVDKNIVVIGRRGEIIGGEVICGRSLRCKKFGNISSTKTKAVVGILPEKIELIEELRAKIESYKLKLEDILANIRRLEKQKKAINPTDSSYEEYNQLKLNEVRIKEQITDMEKEYKEVYYLFISENGTLAIIESIVYPNCIISFGREEYKSSEREISKLMLKMVSGKIKEYGFNYKEIPQFNFL